MNAKKFNTLTALLLILPLMQVGGFLFSNTHAAQIKLGANIPQISGNGEWVAFSSEQSLAEGDTNDMSDAFVYNRANSAVEKVSVTNSGEQGKGESVATSISNDGRFVTFYSQASNFSEKDKNNFFDVFVYDRQNKTVEIVSLGDSGQSGNGNSWLSRISGDGSVVAFVSEATNLGFGGASGSNLYVFDRNSRALSKVANASKIHSLSVSDSGQSIAYIATSSNQVEEVFVYNRATGALLRASVSASGQQANRSANSAEISGNGQFVAWSSSATNLVDNDTNNQEDIFLRDLSRNVTTRPVESFSGSDSKNPVLSYDASSVVFQTTSDFSGGGGHTNTQQVYRLEISGNRFTRVSNSSDGNVLSYSAEYPSVSDNGNEVTFVSNGGSVVTGGNFQPENTNELAESLEEIASQDNLNRRFNTPAAGLLGSLLLLLLLKPLELFSGFGSIGSIFQGYQIVYTKYFLSFLSFIGLRKKRRVWGTVYDSNSKQPLDPAVVELIDATTGEVKEQAITDLAGRFGFLPASGNFKLRASKTHYAFPSVKEQGSTDEIFDNLYHGEILSLRGESTLVAPNIPMDPVGFDWNQEAKQKLLPSRLRLQYALHLISNAIYITGFIYSFYNLYSAYTLTNTLVFGLYVVIFLARIFFKPKQLWGRLTENNKPIEKAYVELTEKQMGIIMGKSLTAADGKFFIKVPQPGQFNLTIKQSKEGEVLYKAPVVVGKEGVYNEEINIIDK